MSPVHQLILCVDDDVDDLEMVGETIKSINPLIRIASASNGLEALQYLNDARPEDFPCLIIMDINMPLLDGKQALSRIKADSRYHHIPIVMFTTSSSLLDRNFCARYGVPFVTKPIRHKELEQVIAALIKLF